MRACVPACVCSCSCPARPLRKPAPHSHRTHRTCTRTPPLHARTCSVHTPHTHAPHMSTPHVHVHAPHVHAPHMHAPHVRLHAPHMHTPHAHTPHICTYLPPVAFARKMGEEKGARISPGATNLSRGHEPPPRPRIFPRAEKGGGVHAGGLKFHRQSRTRRPLCWGKANSKTRGGNFFGVGMCTICCVSAFLWPMLARASSCLKSAWRIPALFLGLTKTPTAPLSQIFWVYYIFRRWELFFWNRGP